MALKILFNFCLIIYSLTWIFILIVGLSIYIKSMIVYADSNHNMNLILDSESDTITVIPIQNSRVMSNFDIVDYKFEFILPHEEIQEITVIFGTNITNNVITGSNADYIINAYIIPFMLENDKHPLIYELFIKYFIS